LELDTVIVNPDDASLVLVWRCALPLEPRIRNAEAMILDREGAPQA
jgi:fructose-specific component phosphotransferase system IIB-like protein